MTEKMNLAELMMVQAIAMQAAEISVLKGGGKAEARKAYDAVYSRFRARVDHYMLDKAREEQHSEFSGWLASIAD